MDPSKTEMVKPENVAVYLNGPYHPLLRHYPARPGNPSRDGVPSKIVSLGNDTEWIPRLVMG